MTTAISLLIVLAVIGRSYGAINHHATGATKSPLLTELDSGRPALSQLFVAFVSSFLCEIIRGSPDFWFWLG